LAPRLGLALDPWLAEIVHGDWERALILCSRQAGKSTALALLALDRILRVPQSLVLLVSPSERQSARLFRTMLGFYRTLRAPVPSAVENRLSLELANGSEVHALPGRDATIRGFSRVDLLIIDEAARVDDDLFAAISPMLAVSRGRLVAATTPFGKRGFFYQEWSGGGSAWHRTKVTAFDVPRIDRAWLEQERRRIGTWWFRQEYLCEFVDAQSQLFASDAIARASEANTASPWWMRSSFEVEGEWTDASTTH
jgi:hypothetical protein